MATTIRSVLDLICEWSNLPKLTFTCQNRCRIIAIDGNIGAGKTTLMDRLEEQYQDCDDVVVLREPVHLWTNLLTEGNQGQGQGQCQGQCNDKNENLLQLFYTDPTKYAFLFQLHIFRTSLNEMQRVLSDPNIRIVFCERSLESSRRVFAQMLRDAGNMTAIEFVLYESMFTDEIVSKYYPTEIVYLDASVDVCHDRICTRARTGEEAIPKDYLSKCAAYYTTWLHSVMIPTLRSGITPPKSLRDFKVGSDFVASGPKGLPVCLRSGSPTLGLMGHRSVNTIHTDDLSMDQVLEQFQEYV